jgi:hypothetical protein
VLETPEIVVLPDVTIPVGDTTVEPVAAWDNVTVLPLILVI